MLTILYKPVTIDMLYSIISKVLNDDSSVASFLEYSLHLLLQSYNVGITKLEKMNSYNLITLLSWSILLFQLCEDLSSMLKLHKRKFISSRRLIHEINTSSNKCIDCRLFVLRLHKNVVSIIRGLGKKRY